MKEVTREQWEVSLQEFDVVLVQTRSLFSWLEWLYSKRFNRENPHASHSLILKTPPRISEADGWSVTGRNSISKYYSATSVWVFRYGFLSAFEKNTLRTFIAAAETCGGRYSWSGILEYAKKYLWAMAGKKYTIKDRQGVECAEYTSLAIESAGLLYTAIPACQIDPTTQLEALYLSPSWEAVGYIENGKFYVAGM